MEAESAFVRCLELVHQIKLTLWFLLLQGKAIGVSIGCILGMFPLFFLDDEKEKEAQPPPNSS